jgi:hypothetical protein
MIDVAFIAAASAFSSSGETARSLLAIMDQDGLVLHAAVVIVAPKTAAAMGAWVAVNSCFSLSVRSWAKSSAIPFGVTVRKPSASARTSLPSGAGGNGLVTEATDSPSDGASAATKPARLPLDRFLPP